MEQENKISTILDKGKNYKNQVVQEEITLNSKQRLTFRRAKINQDVLGLVQFGPKLVFKRRLNSKFIIAESNTEQKIYQIKANSLDLTSQHALEIPVDFRKIQRIITGKYCRYIILSKHLKNTEKTLNFIKKHKIERNPNLGLMFEFEWGSTLPGVIKPVFVGEVKHNSGEIANTVVKGIFESTKPLVGRQLALIDCCRLKKTLYKTFRLRHELELAELDKSPSKCLVKSIFRFQLNFKELDYFKVKIEQDEQKVNSVESITTRYFRFEIPKNDRLSIEADLPGLDQKLKFYWKVSESVLILGLINMRSRKILNRRLISIYELLENLDFARICESVRITINKIDYLDQGDLLVFDSEVEISYTDETRADIASVIRAKLEAGRRDRSKLTEFTREAPGKYREVKRLRFRVANALKGGGIGVDVETIGVGVNSSFLRLNRSILISFKETVNNLKFEFLRRDKGHFTRSDNYEENNRVLAKERKKVLQEKDKLLAESLNLSEILSSEGREGVVSNINWATIVDETKLLIVDSKNLILYETKTNQILSDLAYASGLPTEQHNMLIREDIIAFMHIEVGSLELLRIQKDNTKASESISLVPIGILDFNFFKQFHSIIELLDFKKLNALNYQVLLNANWMDSPETAEISDYLLSIKFSPNPDPESKKIKMKRISTQTLPYPYYDKVYDHEINYFKQAEWNHLLIDKSRVMGLQLKGQDNMVVDLQSEALNKFKVFENAHIRGNTAYLVMFDDNFHRYSDKSIEIILIKFVEKNSSDVMISHKVVKSVYLDETARVYFDEVTNLTRIFIIHQQREQNSVRIQILDEELDQESQLIVNDIIDVSHFSVVNEGLLLIVGIENQMVGNGLIQRVKLSMVVDIQDGSIRRVVGVEGDDLFSVTHHCFGESLIGFTKDYESFVDGETFDGVFIANLSD